LSPPVVSRASGIYTKENNKPHGNLKKVAELLLCLPGSNAYTASACSHMNYMWSEEKSRFHLVTIQAILAVKTNDLCLAFAEILASNPGVLLKINITPSHGTTLQNNQGKR
jgi:hypothetical protein